MNVSFLHYKQGTYPLIKAWCQLLGKRLHALHISNKFRTFAAKYHKQTPMARTTLFHPFDTMLGKLTNADKIILRTRNGRTHAYTIRHPYTGPAAPARQRTMDAFASAVSQAKTILADPAQRADWQRRFDQYTAHVRRYPASNPKPCTTLRGFIISTPTRTAEQ